MGHPTLSICTWQAGTPPDTAEAGSPRPRPLSDILADLDATPWATGWVIVDGANPDAHPLLIDLVREMVGRGRRVKVELPEAPLPRLRALQEAGASTILVRLHGADAATHERVTALPGSFAEADRTLHDLRTLAPMKAEIKAWLTATNAGDLPALIDRAAALGVAVRLQPIPTPRRDRHGLRRPGLTTWAAAMSAVRRRAEAGAVELDASACVAPPPLPKASRQPVPLTSHLIDLLHDAVPQADVSAGCVAAGYSPPDANLGHRLAAWRCPPVDLPPALGGPGSQPGPHPVPRAWQTIIGATVRPLPVWTPAPGPRITVLNPAISDRILTLHTLPALARALVDLGAEVQLATCWPEGATTAPADLAGREQQLWRRLDLSASDVVIAPGWATAARVLDRDDLGPFTRLVVADLHMLQEVSQVRERLRQAPHRIRQLHVHACFPSYVHLYQRAGIALDQVLWRPYPIDTDTFRPGPPPTACERAFAGGNQRRDWSVLAAAARALSGPGAIGIDLYTGHAPPPMDLGTIRWRGSASLLAFHEAIAQSRMVILPVGWEPDIATGVSVAALAIAAHRPVIASHTPALIDHLRHGQDALMVQPGHAEQLATAITSLSQDDEGLSRLSAGAALAAQRLSVARWAREILHGAEPVRVVGKEGGPWYPW